MMHEKVKQIMPAPGWRVWGCHSFLDAKAEEFPVIGWGVVEYEHDDVDVRDLKLSEKKFTSVELVVYMPSDDCTISVRSLHVSRLTVVQIFPPNVEVTEVDKEQLEADVEDLKRTQEEQQKKILRLQEIGLTLDEMVAHMSIPRGEIQNVLHLESLKQRETA